MDPRRAELEAAIEADPYDARAYAVYGDFLLELGDPRGELIALHLASANAPDPRFDSATRELVARHPKLLPPGHTLRLRWQHGFIQRAELPAPDVEEVVDHPSSRFLAELTIFWSLALGPAVDTLARSPRRALRELVLGGRTAEASTQTPDDDPHPDLTSLWAATPNLERLTVYDDRPDLGRLDLPRLVKLSLRTTQAEPFTSAVAAASWPALQAFDLGLEMVSCGPVVLAHLRRFLVEAPPPKLEHFGLRAARRLLFDAMRDPRDLAAALGRLRSLDLTRNLLVDDDVDPLVRSGVRLERLDVSRNQLTAEGIRALSTIATTVIADDQHDRDDDPIDGLYDY
jgi:uncharacterized protein (TIGR02996 family)